MKKIFFSGLLFTALFILSGCGNPPAVVTDDSAIILFYSTECSHCKVVEKYIADNNVKARVNFSEKEVGSDKANANLMIKKQKECQLAKAAIGSVPFLWTTEECFSGSEEIINFFKTKNGA
jgi:glutaredoxin